MHALMLDGDKDAAFRVFQSMLAAGVDARKGWLLLCKDWFRFGCASPLLYGHGAVPWHDALSVESGSGTH